MEFVIGGPIKESHVKKEGESYYNQLPNGGLIGGAGGGGGNDKAFMVFKFSIIFDIFVFFESSKKLYALNAHGNCNKIIHSD